MGTVKQPGWSLLRLLSIAAVAGIVGGMGLAAATWESREPEDIATEAVGQQFHLGEPVNNPVSMEPDPASLAGIPPYPGAAPRKLGAGGAQRGVPMTVSWFQTGDAPEQVLAFYDDAFRREGREPMTQRLSDTMGYSSWMSENPDGGAGLLHMVSVMHQYGQTMVLLSASRPEVLLNRDLVLPGGLALPANAQSPQIVDMGLEQGATQVVYSRVAHTTAPDVAGFFERQFRDQGYRVVENTATSLVGEKGDTMVVVGVRAEAGSDVSVVLTYAPRAQEARP